MITQEMKVKEMVYEPKYKVYGSLYEGEHLGYHFEIISKGFHPAALIRIPKGHCYFAVNYYDYNLADLPILRAHGPIYFSRFVGRKWMIGWDYDQFGDYSGYYPDNPGKKWTTEEIITDVHDVIEQLKAMA